MSRSSSVRIWDLPVRLCHWLLVILVAGLYLTGEVGGFDLELPWPGGNTLYLGNMDVHALLGQAVLGVLVFRVLWGFFGSTTARFSDFVRGPASVIRYLRELLSGRIPEARGHNPAGAVMVLLLLLLLAAQAGTGLFASDDFFFEGPLAHRVDSDTSQTLTRLHKLNFNGLLFAIGLHVLASVYYLIRGKNLIGAMVHGRKSEDQLAGAEARPQFAGAWKAWLVAVLAVAAVWGLQEL